MSPGLQRVVLGLVELPIAFGLAFAVFVVTVSGGCKLTSCVDLQSLPWVIAGLVAGIVLGIIYWIRAAALKTRWRVRLAVDAVALAAGILSYAVPQIEAKRQASVSLAQTQAANEQFARERLRWIESLKTSATAHGPVGAVPPMLDVADDGVTVRVTNLTAKGQQIALARVTPDAAAPGGWRGCALYADVSGHLYHPHWLAPKQSESLGPDPRCADEFAGAPLEYRVGIGSNDDGWWSDSAFGALEGRELPRGLLAKPAQRGRAASAPKQGDLLAPAR